MKIEHQGCIIHFRKALNRNIKKQLNKIKSKIKGTILFENPNITDNNLNEEIKEIMKPIEKQYWSYKDDIMKAFEIEDFEESSQYIQNLRKEVEKYPKVMCKYLTSNFLDIYRSLILYKHRVFKDKIPSNNSLSKPNRLGASK